MHSAPSLYRQIWDDSQISVLSTPLPAYLEASLIVSTSVTVIFHFFGSLMYKRAVLSFQKISPNVFNWEGGGHYSQVSLNWLHWVYKISILIFFIKKSVEQTPKQFGYKI